MTDENGAVVGVEAEADGTPVRIKASAVLLGTGGFDHDPQMMAESIDHPVYLTNATEANTGDGHRAAARIGAKLALMDTYWGTPFFYPADPATFDASAATQFSATSCDWNAPPRLPQRHRGERRGQALRRRVDRLRPLCAPLLQLQHRQHGHGQPAGLLHLRRRLHEEQQAARHDRRQP